MSRGFDYFLVHVDAGANRKLRRLTPPERWCWVAGVLAIAATSPERGALLIAQDEPATVEDIAEQAGVPKATAKATLTKLQRLGEIEHDAELGALVVTDWDKHQPSPRPSETTDAWRERKQRQRTRERDPDPPVPPEGHADVTRDAPRDVPAVSRGEGKVREEEQQPTSSLRSNDVEPPRLDQAKTRLKDNAVRRVFAAWQTARTELTGHPSAVVLTDSRRRLITRRLKEWPEQDLIDATQGWLRSPHHRGENDRQTVYGDLELVLRDAAHIERFRDLHRNEAARPGARQSRNVVDLMPANRDPDAA